MDAWEASQRAAVGYVGYRPPMQTLLDPYEVHFPPPPVKASAAPLPGAPIAAERVPVEAHSEGELPRSLPQSPDSSGRLRCWCSDDY